MVRSNVECWSGVFAKKSVFQQNRWPRLTDVRNFAVCRVYLSELCELRAMKLHRILPLLPILNMSEYVSECKIMNLNQHVIPI